MRGRRSNWPKSKEAEQTIADAVRHQHYTFPTLTIRQAHILLKCMELGLDNGVDVDGKPVTGEEWITLVKTLVNIK